MARLTQYGVKWLYLLFGALEYEQQVYKRVVHVDVAHFNFQLVVNYKHGSLEEPKCL